MTNSSCWVEHGTAVPVGLAEKKPLPGAMLSKVRPQNIRGVFIGPVRREGVLAPESALELPEKIAAYYSAGVLVEIGLDALRGLSIIGSQPVDLDIISGCAGAILALLAIYTEHREPLPA